MTTVRRNRRGFLKPLALVGVVAFLLLFLAQGQIAHAAAITVNTKDDELNADGDCSLREAIQAANTDAAVDACTAGSGADTIDLPAVTLFLSIPGVGEDANATGDLDITNDLSINGAGAGMTIIDGAGLDRVFHIVGGTVGISGVTIRNGSEPPVDLGGGGIFNRGRLTLNSSTVSGNVAIFFGGGIHNDSSGTLTLNSSTVSGNGVPLVSGGGGIFNRGTLTLNGSTVSGNTSSAPGGGIWSVGGTVTITNSTVSGNTSLHQGGGIENGSTTSTMTLTNSTVSGNTGSVRGGGIVNTGTLILADSTVSGNTTTFIGGEGGGIHNNGTATITNSTVSGNTAVHQGGGIRNLGTMTLTNSTVSDNTSQGPGGAGGIYNAGTLEINSSTVSGNTANVFGGGIRNALTATLKNTIVANNTVDDCSGSITSAGHNLIEDTTGCAIGGDTTGNIVGSDPLLGPLANNGGPTQTHALLTGSPAIDAGSPDCPPPATDQRGVARPQGAACDIGAFELVADSDNDGVLDADDACPDTPGLVERQGCPVGDANTVMLHTIDQQKSGACPGGKGSCKSPIEGAEVRVFDRNDAGFQTAYGTKNPSGSIYDQVFENDTGRVGACTTDASGQCTAGEENIGDYLVIVKWADPDNPPKVVYTGKPKSPEDFDATGLASKDFQVIKVLKKNGDIQISGGSKTVVTGSYLEVVHPDFAIWEDAASGYVYPFIFTSDSDWNVDICAYVPTGYAIVGVYDENGNLLTDSSCTQTFVSGETKVVAYDVIDIGSPEPVLGAVLSVSHEGEVTQVDVEVPGERIYVEEAPAQPAQLPDTGAGGSGGGGGPVWLAVAALAGVSAMLLGGIAVWRRLRV